MRKLLGLLLTLVLGVPAWPQGQTGGTGGMSHKEESSLSIETDMPYQVTPGHPFKIDVWIEGLPPNDHKIRKVYMEQTDAIQYSPRVLYIQSGKRSTTEAKVLRTTAGLAVVEISGLGLDTYSTVLNAGFNAKFHVQTFQTVDSRSAYGVALKLVNQQDVAVALDAPVRVTLRASNALLRQKGDAKWAEEIQLHLLPGSTATDLFEMMPTSVTAAPIGLATSVEIDDDSDLAVVVSNDYLTINVKPAWWFVLGLAILGGIVPGVYRLCLALAVGTQMQGFLVRSVFNVFAGIVSGAGAYLLADLDVIGVKLDTSSPRTFCILGFLFAYVGLDFIMSRFTPLGQREPLKGTEQHPDQITKGIGMGAD